MEIWRLKIHIFIVSINWTGKIFDGDFLDVQTDPVTRKVYKKPNGQLYFTPYDKGNRVSVYFEIDAIKIGLNS